MPSGCPDAGAISEDCQPIDGQALDRLFREARSQNGWRPGEVDERQLRAIWDIAKWGPTSANCSPVRVRFLRSLNAKRRLEPHLDASNVSKAMTAPVVALFGFDLEFYLHLPRLFHNPNARSWFEGVHKKDAAYATAFRNSTLQAAYLMLAARAIGLDCGPMSGFNQEAVDREFWAGTMVRTNFICGIGRGDPSKLYHRHPRFDFDDVCQIL
jgi:3-hydroxypropanoate dehydrogenase